ncbi:hypothetical protein Tco_1246618 [Tanacetum coccineum]
MVPTLIIKVDSLEIELKQTKQTMGKAIVKLVKKVKKLENILKRRNVRGSGRRNHPTTMEAAKTLSKVASQRSKSVDKRQKQIAKSVIANDMSEEDFAKRMVDLNQGTWKLSQLKKLKFEEIKEEFDKLVKQVDTFVPMSLKATKAELKRFGEELQTKTTKRQKIDDKDAQSTEEKEKEPVKKMGKRRKQIARKGLHTAKDEAEKDEASEEDDSSSGKKGVYQIVRENGTDKVYMSLGAMLKEISREDLTELYRIVMKRYGTEGPTDDYERVFWENLKTMFDAPLSTDLVWSLPGQQKILSWRYYETCRVHCLNLDSADIYMLAERKYPLSANDKHVSYQTNLPNIRDVVQNICIPSSHQNCSNPTIILRDNLPPNIKDWELIIHENVICVDTYKSSINACSAIMLYHLKNSQKFNLAYFIDHKIKSVKNRVDCSLPYVLLITNLYQFVLAKHPKLFRPHHTLQFVLHYPMMSSINRMNERKRNESEEVKLNIPYSPSSVESSNQSSPLLGYWVLNKLKLGVLGWTSSEHSTCQSNNSEGFLWIIPAEHSFENESESLSCTNEMSKSKHKCHSNAVMGSWGSAVKTSASYNWRNSRRNFNYNSGPTFIRTVNAKGNMPLKNMVGQSKGLHIGKGRIRVGNLDFDSVSFVKELGHFNLFSISQICDKQHKVLFTETECLVVSSDFKMPDENQILLKVPRHHNMHSFDMKTPTPAKESLMRSARTMLADSLLPTTFWAEADTLSVLGKFDGKSDEGFLVEIVDFLRGSNLMYALTNNPTIHDSLVKQFWQTATATTLADRTLELKETIDTIEHTITKASIRSKLQLANASGITMLPNNDIFEGMRHMGGFRGVPRPLLPAMLSIANPSAGQEAPSVTQPQPSSSVVPPTPPTTQPIPSEATNIPPLSKPAPPTPIAETTAASPSPSPSH